MNQRIVLAKGDRRQRSPTYGAKGGRYGKRRTLQVLSGMLADFLYPEIVEVVPAETLFDVLRFWTQHVSELSRGDMTAAAATKNLMQRFASEYSYFGDLALKANDEVAFEYASSIAAIAAERYGVDLPPYPSV